jgi:hypothetical protein
LGASDNESGITAFSYSVDGGYYRSYAGAFDVSNDDHHRVDFRAEDGAGWITEGTLFLDIDATIPTVSGVISPADPTADPASQNGWYLSDPVITLTASDNLSGVAATYYSVDGGAAAPYTSPISAPTGIHIITYWAKDFATNTSSVGYFATKVDIDLPTATFVTNNYDLHHGDSVLVAITSADLTSGTANATVQFSTDNGATWGDPLTLDAFGKYSGTVALPPGFVTDSLYGLWMKVRDNAGHTSAPITGPAPRSVLDVLPNLTISLGVSPVVNGVCSGELLPPDGTIYWSNNNIVTWPTEQAFCILPRIIGSGGAMQSGGLVAVVEAMSASTSYTVSSLTDGPDGDTRFLSQPSTTSRVSYYGGPNGQPQEVLFTPVHETEGDGVTLNITITTMVAFYAPGPLDANGVPLPEAVPDHESPIAFPVTGQVVILNSGTIVVPAATSFRP